MIVLNAQRQLAIAGTNITVAQILHTLKYYSVAGVVQLYPQLSDEDILDCLDSAIRCLPRLMNLPLLDPISPADTPHASPRPLLHAQSETIAQTAIATDAPQPPAFHIHTTSPE